MMIGLSVPFTLITLAGITFDRPIARNGKLNVSSIFSILLLAVSIYIAGSLIEPVLLEESLRPATKTFVKGYFFFMLAMVFLIPCVFLYYPKRTRRI